MTTCGTPIHRQMWRAPRAKVLISAARSAMIGRPASMHSARPPTRAVDDFGHSRRISAPQTSVSRWAANVCG